MPRDTDHSPDCGDQQERLAEQRRQIAAELPDLMRRNKLAREAKGEPTLSGELRRAVHCCKVPLADVADAAGITPVMLSEFLTGERTLRSDVLDRLAHALGYELKPVN